MNQIEVEDMFARWDEITVHAFADVMCHELIERLLVSDILCMKGSKENILIQRMIRLALGNMGKVIMAILSWNSSWIYIQENGWSDKPRNCRKKEMIFCQKEKIGSAMSIILAI